jgi:HD superfamily phosphohydrolase
MKVIHCNLWGDINVSDLALSIIDTPHFQRLHYIRQTGLSYKVFPSSHTSRFEHSLGTFAITRILLDHLILNQPDLVSSCDAHTQELICIAGLVHDLGHGPFSHFFDWFLNLVDVQNEWMDHEQRSIDIFKDLVIKFNIQLSMVDIQFIEDLIKGKDNGAWYDCIINNQQSGLDMDKMDYLLRDSQSFGMKLSFDPLRIIKNSRIINNQISFSDRIKDEIMTVFLIRNKMNRFIYRHKKIVEFENILLHFLIEQNMGQELIDIIKSKDVYRFIQQNDIKLLSSFPFDEYSLYESRKKRFTDSYHLHFEDTAWEKIKNTMFFNKKKLNENFLIHDWNIHSCYS